MVEPFESSSRHALITRPREDATEVAAAVMRRGVMPVISPVLTVEHLDVEIGRDVDRCQAILFTSGNGVRAFCRLSDRRDRHAYVVGSATAALARDSGFGLVTSADGNSGDLARLVAGNLSAYDGPLFHAAGTAVAGDLSKLLDEAGFETVRRTLYAANPVDRLPAEAEAALGEDRLDYVLLFSPRTAKVFVRLVEAAGLGPSLGRVVAVCLSEAVAGELAGRFWKEVRVAELPTLEAMAEAVDPAAPGESRPQPGAASPPWEPGAGQPSAPSADAGPDPEIEIIVPEDAPARPGSGGAAGESADRGMPRAAPWGPAGREAAGGPASAPAAGGPGTEPAADDGPRGPGPAGAAPREAASPRGGRLARGIAIAAGAVAVAAILALGYLAWSLWQARPDGGEVRALLALNESQRVELARLAEQRNAELAGLREERALLAREVAGLKNRLAAAETRLGGVAGLDARLGAVEEAVRTPDRNAAAGLAERVAGVESGLADAEKARAAAEEQLRTGGRTVAELRAALDGANARIDGLESLAKAAREAPDGPARTAAQDAAVVALRAALDGANARIDELGSLVKAAREAAGDPAPTAAEGAAVAELRAALDRASARIGELGARVEAVREQPAGPGRDGIIALAASRLREALAGPRPFAKELAAVERLAAGDARIANAVAPLAPHAADGVPSRVLLFDRFPDVVRAVAAAVPEPPAGGSWWERAAAELGSLVSIRRVDGRGGGVEAMLARAETQARRGDLASAVLELSRLEGRPAAAARRWLDEARARLAVESVAAELDYVILDRLGAAGG